MSDKPAGADREEPQPLDDPSGFGPEDIAGNGPVTSSPTSNETPAGDEPGDSDNHDDPEAAPTS